MKYYISDLHLGDLRVFNLCGRDYTIEEFNELIVRNWNSIIKNEDEVYIVGDIAQDDYDDCLYTIERLRGRKTLIIGNHDLKLLANNLIAKKLGKFLNVKHFEFISDQGRLVFLSHYPAMDWMEYTRGSYHIYGHIHNKNLPQIKNYYKDKLAYNASCDVIGFTPRTLDELVELKRENTNEPYIN